MFWLGFHSQGSHSWCYCTWVLSNIGCLVMVEWGPGVSLGRKAALRARLPYHCMPAEGMKHNHATTGIVNSSVTVSLWNPQLSGLTSSPRLGIALGSSVLLPLLIICLPRPSSGRTPQTSRSVISA